jgi:hypothetical protein
VKLPRPDVASLVIVALCVVGIVVLALFHVSIPDVLTYVAVGALGIGGGTALNTNGSDATAQRIAAAMTSLEGMSRIRASVPSQRPAPAPATFPAQPAPAGAAS